MRRGRIARTSAVAIAFALACQAQSGCVFTMDTLTRNWPSAGPVKTPGTSLPVRAGAETRAVKLDRDHGLVCMIEDASVVRSTWIETDARNPNGVKGLVVLLTILEGSVVALAAWKGDAHFQSPYFLVPAGLDVGWGVFRSITIHPEIISGATVSVDEGEQPGSTSVSSAPCPVGTVIVLAGDGETLAAHVGVDGWLEPAEIPALVAFLTAHASPRLASSTLGANLNFDASAAAEIVAKARREADEQAARGAPPGPPPATAGALSSTGAPPRARAIVRLDAYGRPRIYGVPIEFPAAALCGGTVGCPLGQRCGDRGDGVPLCFGLGAIHRFCQAQPDCAAGICTRRPDGVGVCQ